MQTSLDSSVQIIEGREAVRIYRLVPRDVRLLSCQAGDPQAAEAMDRQRGVLGT